MNGDSGLDFTFRISRMFLQILSEIDAATVFFPIAEARGLGAFTPIDFVAVQAGVA